MTQKRTSTKPADKSTQQHKREKRSHFPWLVVGSVGAVTLVIVGILIITRMKSSDQPASDVTAAEAFQKYQQGTFILDVRTQEEWNQFHIPNSTNIPLDQLQNRLSELPRDKDIVVVCKTGHRSQDGKTILQQAGFTRITCLSGGLQAWNAAGYQIVGSMPK